MEPAGHDVGAMRLNLVEQAGDSYQKLRCRYKLAEIIAVDVLHAILTTKYPPKVLDTEFFNDMKGEEKNFLKDYWMTFDLFKPDFTVNDEIPHYNGFALYEVKSKIITEKNKTEIDQPEFNFSFNQKKCFEKCAEMGIPLKIFAVFFLDNWTVEIKQFDYSEVKKSYVRNNAWQEERMKRIKSSKLNQFFDELYPEYVLYKVDETELELRDVLDSEEYVSSMIKEPDEAMRKSLEMRAKRHHKKFETRMIQGAWLKYGQAAKSKAFDKWNKEEDNKLRREFNEGKSTVDMAGIHRRLEIEILSRLKKLGLIDYLNLDES